MYIGAGPIARVPRIAGQEEPRPKEEVRVLVTLDFLDAAASRRSMREVAAGLRSTLSEHVLQLSDRSAIPSGGATW